MADPTIQCTKDMKSEHDSQVSEGASEDGAVKELTGFRVWAQRLAVEITGIQRVTEADRQHHTTRVWNAATFWYADDQIGRTPKGEKKADKGIRLSANTAVATLSTGMVGGSMGLAFWDCFAIILVINLFSCLLPAWTASFGLSGLRMTTFS